MEIYVLVSKKPTLLPKIAAVLMLLLAAGCFYLLMYSSMFVPFVFLFCWLFYMFWFNWLTEYEYSYFDGEIRFTRIRNKSSRKELQQYDISHVITIAPAGDRSVLKYETDSMVHKINYASGYPNAAVYDMVLKEGEKLTLIKFEPDEKYLNEVRRKNAQKVILRKES